MKLHLPHHLRAILVSSLLTAVGLTLNSGSGGFSISSSGGDDTVSLTIHPSQDSGSLAHRTMVLENSLAGSLNSGSLPVVRTNSAGIIPVSDSSAQTVSPAAAAELVTTASPSPQQQVVATSSISTPQIAALSFPTPVYPAPLALAAAETSTATYTPPSEITIPAGYTKVLVDSVSDITRYRSSATDVAFRLTADVAVDGRTSALMTSSADSWYFTSDSVDNLQSLVFSNATSSLFDVASNENLEFSRLERVEFSGNKDSYSGGAIYGGSSSTITLSGNGSVEFSGNTASSSSSVYGGAIYGYYGSTITLSDNGSVTFSGNTASSSYYDDAYAYGGAIYGDSRSTITLSGNGSVEFSGNTASSSSSSSSYACGGAIYGDNSSTITLSNNGSVTFSGNTASSSSSYDDAYARSYGGAIYGGENSTITLSNNGSVEFSGNTASSPDSSSYYYSYAYGGAIYGYYGSTITLSDNGSVTFSGNTASSSSTSSVVRGGAIYGGTSSTITLSGNGSVTFSGNTASSSSSDIAYGGAIYAGGNLSIRNNDSVLFEKNAEISNGTYRLRSIYAGGSGDAISLSAAEGKSIEFRDSVYIASGYTVNLNEDYTDADGVVHKQTGDILFTGKYTETHLNELLAAAGENRTATEQEILDSLTAEVNAMTYLYGGRLRVEDGAVYKGQGITAMEGSASTVLVKDAVLNHAGYHLTFSSGSTLELVGNSKIYADTVQMMSGSSLLLDISQTDGVYILESSLCLEGSMQLIPGNNRNGENIKLMLVSGGVVGWDDDSLSVSGNAPFSSDDIQWVGHFLVANYNETTFKPYAYDQVTFTQQQAAVDYCFYEGIQFNDCNTTSYGGAIYGGEDSTITLNNNGSVEFIGNTASSSSYAYGGAIYGDSNSTITLSGNDSVTFSENTARYGGAIYGSTIELSGNVSVEFSGNTAFSGGAIYGDDGRTIELSGNGSVEFSGNTARYGGAIYGDDGSTVELSDNESVTFSGNTASSSDYSSSYAYGGAICGGSSSTITLSENGSVTFSGNRASVRYPYSDAYGGAIYGVGSTIRLIGNDSVEFSGNTASSSDYSSSYAYGGAIYGSTIELSGNGSVTFSGNTASSSRTSSKAYGGAIYGSTIELSGNGSVTFSGNTASSSGGAIYGSTIELSGNGSVTFSGNTASSSGGAIYGGGNLSIRNNDSVLFEKNAEIKNGTYRLRSIYARGSGDVISLSAAEGKSIEFRDSVYIASGNTVNLNADYTDADGLSHKQTGDIIFTGKYTESHLNELLAADNAATAEEILYSRITEVNAMTNLYGGRLRVEDGAVYMGYGITAMRDSSATVLVKDATLNHAGYDLTFQYGTSLELEGNSSVYGDISMWSGSTLHMVMSETTELDEFYVSGDLYVGGDVLISGAINLNKLGAAERAYVARIGGDYVWDTFSREKGRCAFSVIVSDRVLGVSEALTIDEEGTFEFSVRPTDYVTWTNAAGNGLWDNRSANWADEGYRFSYVQGTEVTLGKVGEGFITLDGAIDINSIKVESSSRYQLQLTEGSSLEVKESLCLEEASHLSVGTSLAVITLTNDGSLNIEGDVTVEGLVSGNGAWDIAGKLTVNGGFAASSLQSAALEAESLILTDNAAHNHVGSSVSMNGAATVAGQLEIAGDLSAASLQAAGLKATSLMLTNAAATNTVGGNVCVSGAATVAGQLEIAGDLSAASLQAAGLKATSLMLTDAAASNTIGSSVSMSGAATVAGQLAISGDLSAASLQAAGLKATSLTLTDNGADNRIGSSVALDGAVNVAGTLEVNGDLVASSLHAGSLTSEQVTLTAEDTANSVSGNLTAASVSLASGASLEVGGTLTAAEVALQGTAKMLRAGAFGADAMNFVLDRAALESLNLSGGDTGTIARADVAMGSGFTATLNGETKPVQAAAYKYGISVNGGEVQLTADYVHDGLRVWSSGKWVGQSGWKDYYIAGYDAADGVETVDLGGDTVQGDNLFIAYEECVRSSVVKNGTLEFAYVDMGGGQFELGEGAEVVTDELFGKGETLVMHQGSVLNATELTLGTLALEGGELTVKKATINAMSGTEGTLNILSRGKVTVKSDVTLTGLENLGTLKLGTNNLTVNALVDVGGNVTAGEVAVQSRGSRMASFDELVADKVTVVNNISTGRYTDDLSVGDGSAIGELVAETLEVREGVVTLGRTDGATEQVLLNLDLQEDAALVLNQQTSLSVTDELSATEGAEVRLKKQASVSYGDLSIGNRGAATQVVVNAAELADGELSELSNAHMALSGSEDRSIDYKLTNSSVENTGSGKLYVTHEENTLSGVYAATGDIAVMNQAMGLNLNELVVGEGVSFSAYRGETESPELEAVVSVSQTVTFGAGAHINADLKLQSGVKVEMNGPVSMGSDLYLFTGMTLGGAMLESLTSAEQGQTVVLFSGIDTLYLDGDAQNAALTLAHGVNASDYFTNLVSTTERGYYLTYDNATPGEGVLSVTIVGMAAVPEPTTATLSLLALAALAARRRRASL